MEVSIILKVNRGHILYTKNTSSTHKKMEDKGRNRNKKSMSLENLQDERTYIDTQINNVVNGIKNQIKRQRLSGTQDNKLYFKNE